MPNASTFALTLRRMDGVGRVTAGRLLHHFASEEEVRSYPREQVLTRIQGAPNGEDLVQRLFDKEAMRSLREEAQEEQEALREKRVEVLTPHHADWPSRLNDLPYSARPFLLYAYGNTELLSAPLVGLLARPPLDDTSFEQAQKLVTYLAEHDLSSATGARTGFDVALQKRIAETDCPTVMVAACGLAQAPSQMRPVITQVVRSGGLIVSPFPMQHGPFEHDEKDAALVLAALAAAPVFVSPRSETPEWAALQWLLDTDRSIFGITDAPESLPDRVHPMKEEVDYQWIATAAHRSA